MVAREKFTRSTAIGLSAVQNALRRLPVAHSAELAGMVPHRPSDTTKGVGSEK